MVTTNTKIIVGFLLVALIATGVIITLEGSNVRIRVDNDKSTIYVQDENNRWIVGAREFNKMFEGNRLLYRDVSNIKVETFIDNESNTVTITRTTPYKRGPVVIDTYFFSGGTLDVTLFPISHTIEVINGIGYIYQYELRDFGYSSSSSIKNVESPQSFGNNIKIEWDDQSYWNTLYKSGILKIKYRPESNYEKYDIRVFDPPQVVPYIIEGNKVYINDSNMYMSAEPHTLAASGAVILNLINKVFTGNATLVVGTNSSIMKPTGLNIYKPHNMTTHHNYTCDYRFNYTLNPHYAWCYRTLNYTDNASQVVYYNSTVFEGPFDSGNILTKTIYWDTVKQKEYIKYSGNIQKIEYNYSNMTTWRAIKDIPLTANKSYSATLDIEVPFRLGNANGKYWVCIMPSSYGNNVKQANEAGHLYCLDPWWNSTFNYCRDINVTGPTSELANFPVFIHLDNTTHMSRDSLRFVNTTCDNSGSGLKFEVERYATNDVDNWVKLVNASAGTNEISVYYNATGVSNGEDKENVWDSSFAAIWHMDSNMTFDSTDNQNNVTSIIGTVGTAEGIAGLATDYDGDGSGQNGGMMFIPDSASLDLSGNLCLEAWLYPESADFSPGRGLVTKDHTGDTEPYVVWTLMMEETDKAMLRIDSAGRNQAYSANSILVVGSWAYVTGCYNSSKLYLFHNGTISGTPVADTGAVGTNIHEVLIGGTSFQGGGNHINGRLDEIRVTDGLRTEVWANYTYNNIAKQSDYVTIGSEKSSDAVPHYTINAPADEATGQDWNMLLNVTILDSDSSVLNITFVNNATGSVLCANTSISNNTEVICGWSGLIPITTYNWWFNVTDGDNTNTTGVLNFTTKHLYLEGTVKTGGGTAIDNATVIAVYQSNDTIAGNVSTNSTGDWRISVPEGMYIVSAYNPSNSSQAGDIDIHINASTTI